MFGKMIVCLGISMVLLLLASSSINTAAVNSPENGLLKEANECSIKKDYPGVADILEKLLTLYPGTRKEDVYFKLGDVYDTNIEDYAKAIRTYTKYLQLFPKGRFCDRFKERLGYLEKNKDHWEIIKRYRFIQRTFYTRSEIENIKMMRELLHQNPNLYLQSDIDRWLAGEYLYLQQSGPALDYIKKYFATFPGNGKPESEKIKTYPLYSEILTKAHQYRRAIAVLKDYSGDDPGRIWEYKSRVNLIIKERRLWTGFMISVSYLVLIVMIIIAIKPWQEKDLRLKPLLKLIALVAVFTLIPMMIVSSAVKGIYKTFPTLTILASFALIITRLLSPVAYKINRSVFLGLSFLLGVAVTYISFYIWDTLFVFWTRVQ
jgi:tetratricopeptide (TPR) repeat protein